MEHIKTIILLSISEIRRLNKELLFHICIFLVFLAVINTATQVFQKPYDTKEAYEKKLGYITYEALQEMDAYEFYKSVKKKQNQSILVFEHNLSIDERAELNYAQLYRANNYKEIFDQFAAEKKIFNIKNLTFQEIRALSREQYLKYQNSIFVPAASKSLMYFYRVPSNNYMTNYPTYEQAKELWEKESMSAFLTREYFARLENFFSLVMAIVIIVNMTKDYKNKVHKKLYATQVHSYEYIMTKGVVIGTYLIGIYFMISFVPYLIYRNSISPVNWIFEYRDLLINFICFIVPTEFFICSVAMFFSVVARDWLFAISFSFYYIFLSGAKMTLLPNGLKTWIIFPFKYFPRIPFAMGCFEQYRSEIIFHNILYIAITILLFGLSCWIWAKGRFREN
ncbi:MAG: hypothetical protein PHV18_03605 [Lachnospiraceae bacterium]|nr:hypothetical protein [Lachnospiraceae bacterium]